MKCCPFNIAWGWVFLRLELLMLGILLLAAGVAFPLELNFEGFQVPDMKDARYIGFMTKDNTDRIPGDETLIKLYMYKNGSRVNVVSIKGEIWSYYVDQDGEPPFEYIIADQNGDGVFESKFDPGEDMVVPYWAYHNNGTGSGE